MKTKKLRRVIKGVGVCKRPGSTAAKKHRGQLKTQEYIIQLEGENKELREEVKKLKRELARWDAYGCNQ